MGDYVWCTYLWCEVGAVDVSEGLGLDVAGGGAYDVACAASAGGDLRRDEIE